MFDYFPTHMVKEASKNFPRENGAQHSKGYTFEQALSDMIDNSIDAKATKISYG